MTGLPMPLRYRLKRVVTQTLNKSDFSLVSSNYETFIDMTTADRNLLSNYDYYYIRVSYTRALSNQIFRRTLFFMMMTGFTDGLQYNDVDFSNGHFFICSKQDEGNIGSNPHLFLRLNETYYNSLASTDAIIVEYFVEE